MIRLLALMLLCGVAGMGLRAQNYDQLWTQAEEAVRKDLPRTALTAVRNIYERACAERNEVQSLRALLYAAELGREISPDSMPAAQARIEAALHAGETGAYGTRFTPELWQQALALTYGARMPFFGVRSDTAAQRKSARLMAASVAGESINRLGALSTDAYAPLLVVGRDSRHFGDDLLHVLARTCLQSGTVSLEEKRELAGRCAEYYRSRGNRNAALLFTLDSISLDALRPTDVARSEAREALLRTAEAYADLRLNVETYVCLTQTARFGTRDEREDSLLVAQARRGIERYGQEPRAALLRNFVAEKETPYAALGALPGVLYPGSACDVELNSRNVRRIEVQLTRLSMTADEYARYDGDIRDLRKRKKGSAATFGLALPPRPAYAERKDSLRLTAPDAGLYLCELYADGKRLDLAVVHVSRLRPLMLSLPDGTCRVLPVDARSGKPVSGGRMMLCDRTGKHLGVRKSYTDGTMSVARKDFPDLRYCLLQAGDDAFLPKFTLPASGYYGMAGPTQPEVSVEIFPDRAVYRPGQQVRFGGVAYVRNGDNYAAAGRREVRVSFFDAAQKNLETLALHTDSFGNFSGTFCLPEHVLTGSFCIDAAMGMERSRCYIRVEEYRRPTFAVEPEEVQVAYAPGDTVNVSAVARTYTDLPVEGARVAWRVETTAWLGAAGESGVQSGTTVTDAAGRCSVPVVLAVDDAAGHVRPLRTFFYTVTFDVTADNGETATASYVLRTATRASWLDANWPAEICREHLPSVMVRQTNAAGQNLTADGTYIVRSGSRDVAEGTFRTGEAFVPTAFGHLPSGTYNIIYKVRDAEPAVCDSTTLLLFSETDTKPAGDATLWKYVRTSAQRDTAFVMVGSPCDSVTLFCDFFYGTNHVESRRVLFSDSLLHFTMAYKPEYGDGVRACFAFVRDGQLYAFSTDIEKPKPDKRLRMQWSSFRSRLTPGQDEEWRLTVMHPDGTPADATVMARMYDASLDAFATHPWAFAGIRFPRVVNGTPPRLPYFYDVALYGSVKPRTYTAKPLDFTRWDSEHLFGYNGFPAAPLSDKVYTRQASGRNGMARTTMMKAEAKVLYAASADAEAVADLADAGTGSAESHSGNPMYDVEKSKYDAGNPMYYVEPRTNFSETAYFHPALRTDGNGTVCIAFTLPQSLTTWNFTALAHTQAMDNGRADTVAVARKDFMVQPVLPRFVRKGDRTLLPATLRNLSEREANVTVRCLLTDARTNAEVGKMSKKVRLAAGGVQTVSFAFDVAADCPLLVCRITAHGDNFSDGEEHYLPVLSDQVSIERSLPFAFDDAGRHTLRIDTLWQRSASAVRRSLTVETTSRPAWNAVAALPVLTREACHGAADWATRYYALTLGDYVGRTNRAIADALRRDTAAADALTAHTARFAALADETPWLRAAESEAGRTAALRALFDTAAVAAQRFTALDNLRALQLSDGSWSWYRGMAPSPWITADVAVLLARAVRMTGNRDADRCLARAMQYLDKVMAEQVAAMRETEKRTRREQAPSELQLRYLYLRALTGCKPDRTTSFLTDRAEKLCHSLTMYGKALTAVVLFDAGRTKAAEENLRSLLEHTVTDAAMGTYFDTDRAQWSPNAYRIPTQTATIEALLHMGAADDGVVRRMRLWLMQARRTQMWETSRATTDAVYALLAAPGSDAGKDMRDVEKGENDVSPATLDAPLTTRVVLERGRHTVAADTDTAPPTSATVGYVRRVYTAAPDIDADKVVIEKTDGHLEWGSVRAVFTLPASEARAAGKGFSLSRRFEVRRGMQEWSPLHEGESIGLGDRVRQVFTITADRDYDFVCLKSSRAACLEPVRPLSGYSWQDGTGCYRVVRDAATEYYFEQIRKGTHVFTEESFADRLGTYQCGLSTVECVYAPEFRAQTAGYVLRVDEQKGR